MGAPTAFLPGNPILPASFLPTPTKAIGGRGRGRPLGDPGPSLRYILAGGPWKVASSLFASTFFSCKMGIHDSSLSQGSSKELIFVKCYVDPSCLPNVSPRSSLQAGASFVALCTPFEDFLRLYVPYNPLETVPSLSLPHSHILHGCLGQHWPLLPDGGTLGKPRGNPCSCGGEGALGVLEW